METNRQHLLNMEIAILDKNLFKQLRVWTEDSLKGKEAKTLGWVETDGVWVLIEVNGIEGVGRIRGSNYVVAAIPFEMWKNAVEEQIMSKYQQIFVR